MTEQKGKERIRAYALSIRPSTASAASFTASDMVGWAWIVRARSSELPPYSMSSTVLRDQFGGVPRHDVGAEHPVGLGVGDDLGEALRLVDRDGPPLR